MVQILRHSPINTEQARTVSRVIFGRNRSVPLLLIVAALAALACTASSDHDATGGDRESVRGLIRGVETQSLLALKSLDLTDEAGNTWHFEAEGKTFASFTPSHLNDHMLLGLRVTVVFRREGERLVVEDITD